MFDLAYIRLNAAELTDLIMQEKSEYHVSTSDVTSRVCERNDNISMKKVNRFLLLKP